MTLPHDDIAGKVNPDYARGELVRVAGASNQAEAEFLQALLLEAGIPSVVRRSRGFDVPAFLAAGPRDVLVPGSGAPAAREMLLQHDTDVTVAPGPAPPSPRVLAWTLAVLALVALIAVLIELTL